MIRIFFFGFVFGASLKNQLRVCYEHQVQAADSLLKLVSELKQTAMFSGFASLNDHVEQKTAEFNQQAQNTDRILARLGDDAAASLKQLESHYYSSSQTTTMGT